ncbi:MAG: xylan 1,4-beta-xylosidase [Clostridia bacterium]|nr:xylan 1,4-beta-xylosidase [Clostridia bacterium]
MEKHINIRKGDQAAFRNRTSMCVGTGRVDLALHEEYQKELRFVQEKCHFQHMRGHGLFSDQMGIYQEHIDDQGAKHVEYRFTYLDRVMDSYLENGMKPFLELGFMPKALAAGEQTIFYWQGHTTPPKDMDAWCALVQETLRHLVKRYGREEVESWPCEIWNEPNLAGFWENADKQKYLELYRATALAVKTVLPQMPVGGPAICGGEGSQQWIDDFLSFCKQNHLPVDFVTRHAYMGQTPERKGKYLYHPMGSVEGLIQEMQVSRNIIDSYPEYMGLPLYITEFNTSYNPLCPIHDTNYNAALCAGLLSRLGDVAEGYSYWTFGDVFEESGIPPRPFHGGFGLMANGLIPKPTLWAFSFFADLQGDAVYKDDAAVLVKRNGGGYEGVLWNLREMGSRETLEVQLAVPIAEEAVALIDRVDEETCNPLKTWHLMGEPFDLNQEQLSFLRAVGQPRQEVVQPERDGEQAVIRLTLSPNALLRVRILPVERQLDEGYDYGYYCQD